MAGQKETGKKADDAVEYAVYQALVPCRVGCYREAGDVFTWQRFEVCPPCLNEVKTKPKAAKPAPKKAGDAMAAKKTFARHAAPGATVAEIFGG